MDVIVAPEDGVVLGRWNRNNSKWSARFTPRTAGMQLVLEQSLATIMLWCDRDRYVATSHTSHP
jgi:hypothetical protein